MLVRDLMKRGFDPVHARDSLRDAARKMKQLETGLLPVTAGKGMIGMLSDRDLALRALAAEPAGELAAVKVRDVMSLGVLACFEHQTPAEALDMMLSKRVSGIVVLDPERRPVGTLSLYDLIERITPGKDAPGI